MTASRDARPKVFTFCVGSRWDPSTYTSDKEVDGRARSHLAANDLASAISTTFSLGKRDSYIYHANVSVTLAQVQQVVCMGDANGLHGWYKTAPVQGGSGRVRASLAAPSRQDSEAYVSIFAPTTVTSKTLKSFGSNAKKGSVRESVAAHLLARRFLHPSLAAALQIARCKTAPPNPYHDFLAWSCANLEWAGPCAESEKVRSSHHVLPVLMHHFGCVCPSHEALSMLSKVSDGRDVLDVGSGNGYWTWMLRQYGGTVRPVDKSQSNWRATWVSDTETVDGVQYLQQHDGGKDAVLLIVYPIVGGGVAGGEEGAFTRNLVEAFQGDTLAVVGTQNHNGYTAFRAMTMDEYMEREEPEWTKVVQIPLLSFPGKDDALFVFQRGERAPPRTTANNESGTVPPQGL